MLVDMHIGKNIRAILKELEISQGALSRLTGIPERTISGWVNSDDPNPGFQYIHKIADVLDVTPGYIADYADERAKWRQPQTWKAKLEVAKALLADVAHKYPHGLAAQALHILDRVEDPEDVQEFLTKAREILLSGSETAIKALKVNIEMFHADLKSEESQKEKD